MVSRKYPWNCEVLSLTSSDCTPVPPLDRSPPIANGLVHRHLVWLIVNAWLGRSAIAIVCVTSGFPHVPAPDSLVCAPSTCAPRNVSPSARKRVRISSSWSWSPLLRIVPGEFPALVHVPLVFLVEVDADLGGVVSTRGPPLQLSEEALVGRLRVRLARRHLREDRDPLVRRSLEERLRVELTRQVIHGLEAGAPLGLPVGLERFRQPAVDVGRHCGGARPGGVVIGGGHRPGRPRPDALMRPRLGVICGSMQALAGAGAPPPRRGGPSTPRGQAKVVSLRASP